MCCAIRAVISFVPRGGMSGLRRATGAVVVPSMRQSVPHCLLQVSTLYLVVGSYAAFLRNLHLILDEREC